MFELPEKFADLKETITATMRPTNILRYTPADTKPWESKLGGCPYLTKKEDYPLGINGEPMLFLAQINLSEMPTLPDFPTKGLIQFYIENNDYYGYDEPCKVVYIEDYLTDESQLLKEHPYPPEEEDMLPYERECRITFETDVMPLSGTDENFDELSCHIEDEEEREELWNLLAIEGSRMGGYPYFIQNPVEVFESGEKGILLLQLDTDDEAGLMFGDCGNCQFFIAEQDLKNKDFSDVFYDWACC